MSYSSTLRRQRPSASAALSPAAPPPTMTTSYVLVCNLFFRYVQAVRQRSMVKTISEHIRMCEKGAAECRANAAASLDPLLNRELLDMEQRWLNIARSYAFFRGLEDYLLELSNQQQPP